MKWSRTTNKMNNKTNKNDKYDYELKNENKYKTT